MYRRRRRTIPELPSLLRGPWEKYTKPATNIQGHSQGPEGASQCGDGPFIAYYTAAPTDAPGDPADGGIDTTPSDTNRQHDRPRHPVRNSLARSAAPKRGKATTAATTTTTIWSAIFAPRSAQRKGRPPKWTKSSSCCRPLTAPLLRMRL